MKTLTKKLDPPVVGLHAATAHEAGGTLVEVALDRAGINRAIVRSHSYAPGCGKDIHVSGTNGGTMPCGGLLTMFGSTTLHFCGSCEERLKAKGAERNQSIWSM